ncbi:MAG TPA: methionyl-tRNA formyltransferase [Steroidobacteraceae bacterium]|nr:methionyl-tRNA formyltransferase [Steroidobacteraceae bacterium]
MTDVSRLRVAFAGTPRFAVPPLAALLSSRHTVVGVLTQPDRPKGRGRQLSPSPVKELALTHGLPIAQPATLADAAGRDAIAALAADVLVVVAYGRILPRSVLRLPRLGCINIHASLLPRWRGAAPIQRAIQAGDDVTGVTIMQMDEGLDTGDMLAVERVAIGERDTSDSLHEVLANVGARALLEVLDGLAAQRLQAIAQPALGVSYAHKIGKAEAHIDWNAAAAVISRQVRAFSSWPVAETRFAGEPLRIHDAHAASALTLTPVAAPGTWLGLDPPSHSLRVACGSGELHVTQVQRAGRKVVAADEFLRAAGSAAGRFG